MILVHLMILVNSCKASLVNEASHKLRNHFWGSRQTPPLYVIFISLLMLCNEILKRRAGTAPILLHNTLCIFAEKVGFYQKKWDFLAYFATRGLGSRPIHKILIWKIGVGKLSIGGWGRGLPFLEESKQKNCFFYAALNGLIFWAISFFWHPPFPWMESFCDWVF